MRKIDGLPSVQKQKTNVCTDESAAELSMVHEGSSVKIEQGNIYLGMHCALMVDLMTQRNRS